MQVIPYSIFQKQLNSLLTKFAASLTKREVVSEKNNPPRQKKITAVRPGYLFFIP